MRIQHPEITKEQIETLYFDDHKSSIEIAAMLNCAKSTILRKMKKFGIGRRNVAQALTGKTIPDAVKVKMSATAKEIQQGSNHSCWKGGRIKTSQGYVSVWVKDHPYASRKGYVFEHRLVMEAKIGRYLRPEEQVHHINYIPDDNRPENLLLCKDWQDHCRAHGGGMHNKDTIKNKQRRQ